MSQQVQSEGEQTSDGSSQADGGQHSASNGSGPDDKHREDKSGHRGTEQAEPEKKDEPQRKGPPPKTPAYKKPAFIITASVVVALLVIGGIIIWLIARCYVSTDDAFIDGHVSQVSAQAGARVVELKIDDNQLVHKGDLLVRLDPTDYQVALDQAKARVDSARGRLAQARAQAAAAIAEVRQAIAQQNSSQASLDNASRDLDRYEHVDERALSKQQLDLARTTCTNARAALESSKAGVVTANANIETTKAAVEAAQGELETARANEKQAEVNLSYCDVIAPIDGRITQRTVEVGNYVTIGQPLCMIVDLNVWVTANFKETQLTHMQPGQPVTIRVDAYHSHKFHGHVDSIQAGSGSRFSVLPAENATGNYVKIVQRVPVKIVFEHDANTNNAFMLSPGLSVIPRVKVR